MDNLRCWQNEASGALKSVDNPEDAEMQCICNALTVLLKSDFERINKIIINSDCKYGIDKVRKNAVERNTPHEMVRKLASILQKKYSYCKISIQYRHVKAHTSTETKRQWVNDWCDQNAKRHMREQVKRKLSSST